jgi:nucleoside-diphosphate-sugar epimerase
LTPYGRTKLIAEQKLLAADPREFSVIILRPRAVIGPYDNTIMPRILRLAARRRFPLIDGGRALTDITWIDNLTDAVRLSLTSSDRASHRVYNICNGEPVSIRDWFAGILKALNRRFNPVSIPVKAAALLAGLMETASRLPGGPREPAFTRFSVNYMARSLTMSLENANRYLGYRPRTGNTESFARYAEWFAASREAGHIR